MGNNPSHFKGDNLPVETVSWYDAQDFIGKLNAMGDGFEYRLPSEAEWEYACRAGTTGLFAGSLDAMAWYGENSAPELAWYRKNPGCRTHPVGSKQPNGFGLYDMHGNVWEWCEDLWHNHYYGAPADGSAWLSDGNTNRRVVRGGSYSDLAGSLRSAGRNCYAPEDRFKYVGFRVAAGAR